MTYYIGLSPTDILNSYTKRYFYGIRRTDAGDLFLGKYDQLSTETLILNKPGNDVDNFPNFVEGQDFYEGRDQDHELIYDNLNYEQFRWDARSITYEISDDGEFVMKTDG